MTSRALFRAERLLAESADTRPVLGIDTGTSIARLALLGGGRVLATDVRRTRSHASELPEAVGGVLGSAGLSPAELGAVAVAAGPGSFTGLRIGLSYAKGLAMASGCALVGVSSLDCLALAALERCDRASGMICAIVDAHRGEVYGALYAIMRDGLEKLTDDLVVTLDALTARIDAGVLVAGDARAHDARARLLSRGIEADVLSIDELSRSGVYVAATGAARLARGHTDPPAALQPIYVRSAAATFRPGRTPAAATRKEDVWSAERKRSFGSI